MQSDRIFTSEKMWFGAFYIYCLHIVLSMATEIREGAPWLRVCVAILLIILLLPSALKKIKIKNTRLLFIIIILIFFTISALKGEYRNFLYSLLFLLLVGDVEYRKIAKAAFLAGFSGLVIVISMYKLGFLHDFINMRGEIERSSLGFGNVNILGSVLFGTVLGYCQSKTRLKFFDFAICSVVIIMCFMVNNCRTMLCAAMAMTLIFLLLRTRIWNLVKRFYAIVFLGYFGAVLLSLCLMAIFDDRIAWMHELNDYLSYRLYWGRFYFQSDWFSFFGQFPEKWKETPMDGIGLFLLIRLGFFAFLFYFIGAYLILKRAVFQDDRILVSAILSTFLYSLVESYSLIIFFNLPMFLIVPDLLKNITFFSNGNKLDVDEK